MNRLTTAMVVVLGIAACTPALAGVVCTSASPCKVCSGIDPGNWRDTIIMPDDTTAHACRVFASSIHAKDWQLGCIANGMGVRWADSQPTSDNGPSVPLPNCGW